jgi:hypothetical protein
MNEDHAGEMLRATGNRFKEESLGQYEVIHPRMIKAFGIKSYAKIKWWMLQGCERRVCKF